MRAASIIISILILIAILIPGPNLPDVDIIGFDKLVHICMFIAWTIAVRYDVRRKPFPYLLVFICGLAFSAFTEVLQILVEGRTFDIFDMIADGIGLIIGLVISGMVVSLIRRLFK